MLHTLRSFFVLLVLLGLQAFGQIALPIAIELGLIAVFAKHTGNIIAVQLEIGNRSPRTNRWQHYGKQYYVDQN